ncbi:MAG: serpin family protein [Mariniphaga sp.]
MKTKFILIIVSVVLIAVGCSHSVIPDPAPPDIVLTQKSLSLVTAGNSFTFNLLHKIPDSQGHNVMVSPLSISLALSMTLNGAQGTTQSAIIEALGLNGLSVDEINQIYLDLVTALKNADSNVAMNIANSIWIRKGYSVLQPFITVNQSYYDAQVQTLDFDQTALVVINDWVNLKTNGKIPKILDKISAEEIMFLINAIYFNGKWEVQFEKSNTQNGPFTLVAGGTVDVPFMKIKERFGFTEQAGYRAIKMPYGRGKFEMVILLPDLGHSADQLMNQMDPSVWTALKTALTVKTSVDVWLPRFKFSWESDLNDILSSLGMAVAFSTTDANFSKINATDQLYITKVKHKTYIDVNEEGTEASGVTSIGIGLATAAPAGPELHATRPFLFFITEEDTGAILFAGKVENPLLLN